MADDVVYVPPGEPPIVGKESLRRFLSEAYDAMDPNITMSPDDLEVAADRAIERGTVTGTLVAPESDEVIPVDFTYLYVYRLEAHGSWVLAWDIYNSNASQ